MYYTRENPTELFYRRQELLLRVARDARLARQTRKEHPKSVSWTGSERLLIAWLRRTIAPWGRTSVPFFRA
jgi:hypothetical protein